MADNGFYLEFFGLAERPFTMLPDPDFLYWSGQHKRGYTILEYGITSRSPITLLTGEIGAGKTTLLQHLLRHVDESVTIGLISNAQGGRGELVQWILNALSVPIDTSASYVQSFQTLQDYLVSEYAAGRRVILIFDEAQNLSLEGLEELRMLTNINANKDELLQLILVGQPELRELILKPELRQLAQRVAASYHLRRMDLEMLKGYVSHRLKIAGGTGDEFTAEACALIHEHTNGIPRLTNQLCDFAMIFAWSEGQRKVTREIVQFVIDEGVFFSGLPIEDEEKEKVS